MNKNSIRSRKFANKNQGQTFNVCAAYDRDGCDQNMKPLDRAFVKREIAIKQVPPIKGKPAKVARNPVIDKSTKHWTMIDQIKFCNAPNRAAAQAVYDSVK